MVNELIKDKRDFDKQILLSPNRYMSFNIKSKLSNNKIKYCASINGLREILSAVTEDEKIRLYVDEFMFCTPFCNNFDEILKDYPELIKNGYFVSSPNNTYLLVYDTLFKLNNNISYTIIKNTNSWF